MSRLDELRDPQTLLDALYRLFKHVEGLDLRVEKVYLHPDQADTLRKAPRSSFDPIDSPQLMRIDPTLKGYLWGASVYIDKFVVAGHAVLVPGGMIVTITGTACGVSL